MDSFRGMIYGGIGCKDKGKVVPELKLSITPRRLWGSGGIAPQINLGNRWR